MPELQKPTKNASRFGLNFGTTEESTVRAVPDPPAQKDKPKAVPAPRRSETPARKASEPKRATPASGEAPGESYQLTQGEPKVRDMAPKVSLSLPDTIEDARLSWVADHRAELVQRLGSIPEVGPFREALMRLGLKHLRDDAEFIDLIPKDGRRRP